MNNADEILCEVYISSVHRFKIIKTGILRKCLGCHKKIKSGNVMLVYKRRFYSIQFCEQCVNDDGEDSLFYPAVLEYKKYLRKQKLEEVLNGDI